MKIAAFVCGDINIFYPGLITLLSVGKFNPEFELIMATYRDQLDKYQSNLLKKYNISLIDISNDSLNAIQSISEPMYFPRELYLRYIIPRILQTTYDYAIYLDAEILCISKYNLEDILPIDTLIAWRRSVKLSDAIKNIKDIEYIESKLKIKINTSAYVPNGGFLVFNLSKKEISSLFTNYAYIFKIIEMIVKEYSKNEVAFSIVEQYLGQKFHVLDYIYNFSTLFYYKKLEEIKNIHFLGVNKPWKKISFVVNAGRYFISSSFYFNIYLKFIQEYEFKDKFEINTIYTQDDMVEIIRNFECEYQKKLNQKNVHPIPVISSKTTLSMDLKSYIDDDENISKIYFYNIQKNLRRINFTVETYTSENKEKNTEEIYFEFNYDNYVSDTALILSLIALIMKSFQYVYIDINVSKKLLNFLKKDFGNIVNFRGITDYDDVDVGNIKKGNISLLFSGGLDSLAAYSLLYKENVKLISFDFGNSYNERIVFNNFQTYIVKTNFRQSAFFKHSSKFYVPAFSVGAIMYAETLGIEYTCSGDVLEASHDFNCYYPNYVFPGSYFLLRQIRPTLGLTEISTTKISKIFQSVSILNKSIKSLATPGSFKRFRKDILLNFFSVHTPIHKVNKKVLFGENYVNDFLFLYIYKYNKNLGEMFYNEIPDIVINFINTHTLAFFDKIHPKSLRNFPGDKCLTVFLRNLFISGISFYDDLDFKELHETRQLLCSFYNEKNNNTKISSLDVTSSSPLRN